MAGEVALVRVAAGAGLQGPDGTAGAGGQLISPISPSSSSVVVVLVAVVLVSVAVASSSSSAVGTGGIEIPGTVFQFKKNSLIAVFFI